MSAVRIVDTNVAIGLVLMHHKFHDNSWSYTVNAPGDVYLPPTAAGEFTDLKDGIRKELRQEFSKHQGKVLAEFAGKDELDRSDLRYARDGLVDDDMEIADALRDYYDELIEEWHTVNPLQLECDLGDMYDEVGIDACQENGGWRSVLTVWTKSTGSYSSLKSSLLICEGPDPDVCIEAHHIATSFSDPTELGTADGDFIDKVDGEKKSRKQDILNQTDLADVIDLR